MTRSKYWIFLALLSLLLMACSYTVPLTIARVWISSNSQETTEVLASPTPEEKEFFDPMLSRVIRSEENDEEIYSIYLEHPEMSQVGEAGDIFNQMIEQLMIAQLGAFRTAVGELDDATKELGKSSYTLSYTVYRSDQQFISLLLVEDVYYSGAVHPGQKHFSVNYDIGRKQFLELSDLFIKDTPFLLIISQYYFQELSNRYEGGVDFDGLNTLLENDPLWNVTADGLLITVEEYQILPYAPGSPQVLVPYEILVDTIDPKGPLGIFVPREELFITG